VNIHNGRCEVSQVRTWARQGSNLRPLGCKAALLGLQPHHLVLTQVVGEPMEDEGVVAHVVEGGLHVGHVHALIIACESSACVGWTESSLRERAG
jgi:hypothetical protein